MIEKKFNKIERLKQTLHPSEYRKRLETLNWFEIEESDRFYLKNFGIYNIKLQPDLFMLRLRIDGGRIGYAKLEQIAKIVEKYNLKLLLTSRAQLELHDISPDTVYEIYTYLKACNISTSQTLTDNFRAIVTDPYDGEALDSYIDCYPVIEKINQLIIDNPYWTGTIPRKFNTAIIGREKPLVNPWSNDLLFALAEKEKVRGFNIYLGGKNAKVAQDADIFVAHIDVLKLFEAVAETYQQYGLRDSRSKIRLFHLIEKEGMAQLRVWIEKRFGNSLQTAGTLLMQSSHYRRETALKEGKTAFIYTGRYGESSRDELYTLLSRAREQGAEIRLGIDQNFHLLAAKEKVSNLLEPMSLITACAGARYCPLSLWDVKEDVHLLPLDKLKKHNISLGFSGCLKGCGRHYFTDVGLIGLRTNLYGETEKALRVFVGAVESPEVMPSRMLYYSVPLRKITQLFDVILDDFERSTLNDFETFSYTVLNRHNIEFLQLWYIARQLYVIDETMFTLFFSTSEVEFNEAKIFTNLKKITKESTHEVYAMLTRELSHLLWDQQEL